MIAKIGRSNNLFGTLSYNNLKIEKEKGEILLTNKMIETADGRYTVSQLAKSFEPYLFANRNTEKHTLHISLNPDPKDNVSDEKYRQMAQQYMQEMGYGEQPFVVFKHSDIDRSHIHIVSVCVDEEGKKISDQFEKVRSMKVCRELEEKFGLISALEKENKLNSPIFKAVNYKKGDIKSQIASVVRHISSQYQFQSLGEYNALLSLFNITAEKVEGELHGHSQRGLLYFPIDHNGKKTANPFKASLFGKKTGLSEIEKHFESCKLAMKTHSVKEELKKTIESILISAKDEDAFKERLSKKGIDSVIRQNENGRIYGMTFIDHQSKTVWNGSRLGKECSANVFNDKWNNPSKMADEEVKDQHTFSQKLTIDNHHLFNAVESSGDSFFESFGGILPPVSNENDFEEIESANRIKRKKMKKKR